MKFTMYMINCIKFKKFYVSSKFTNILNNYKNNVKIYNNAIRVVNCEANNITNLVTVYIN